MKTAKKFDCVAFKDRQQAKLSREHKGLNQAQSRERALRKLATSKTAVGKLWRALSKGRSK